MPKKPPNRRRPEWRNTGPASDGTFTDWFKDGRLSWRRDDPGLTSGMEGHSDADVLSHAITDALLGAASLGDIGLHFPDTDEQWSGASSDGFLRHAVRLVGEKGYRLVNVDATVILERPKLKDYRLAIRQNLASILELDLDRVSLKFKTAGESGSCRRRAIR